MTITRHALPAVLTVALAAAPGGAQESAPPEVRVEERDGFRVATATVPGFLLDLAFGPGFLLALTVPGGDPDEDPRAVYRFDPAGAGRLERVADDLDLETRAVALLDLDADGRPEVLVATPKRLASLGPADAPAAPRTLLETAIDLESLRRHRFPSPWLPQAGLGRVALYRPDGAGGLARARTAELPLRARRDRTGLRLSTPPVALLERPGGEPLLLAGPEQPSSRRLRTTLVDAGAPEDAELETWARLPGNERIAQSGYLWIDERPALYVAALDADRFGVLEKKKLRVFPLRADRTRAGAPPAFELPTATRHWWPIGVRTLDFDADGRDDLAVLQPDGLGAKKLLVEVYPGKGNGGFLSQPRRSIVVAPEAAWDFGPDVDGDGVADLVTRDRDGRLRLFPGTLKKRQVVDKTPRWDLETGGEEDEVAAAAAVGVGEYEPEPEPEREPEPVPETAPRGPRLVDLDGDGRAEVVLSSLAAGGTRLRILSTRR